MSNLIFSSENFIQQDALVVITLLIALEMGRHCQGTTITGCWLIWVPLPDRAAALGEGSLFIICLIGNGNGVRIVHGLLLRLQLRYQDLRFPFGGRLALFPEIDGSQLVAKLLCRII